MKPLSHRKSIMSKRLRPKLISYLTFFTIITLLLFFQLIDRPNLLTNKSEYISCRIGMTTNPERRRKEWKRDYRKQGNNITSWSILNTYQSKTSAQKFETKEAKKQNCEANPGGKGPEKAIWYVYKLEYSNQ